jgi:hypothetical protein
MLGPHDVDIWGKGKEMGCKENFTIISLNGSKDFLGH